MPQKVNYGGEVHFFPDDFTDKDIEDALFQVDREKEAKHLKEMSSQPHEEEKSKFGDRFVAGVFDTVGKMGEGLKRNIQSGLDMSTGKKPLPTAKEALATGKENVEGLAGTPGR